MLAMIVLAAIWLLHIVDETEKTIINIEILIELRGV